MSKAVTNEEVEDVLSSIRRLVSEDKRPLAGLRSAPPEPVIEPEQHADEQVSEVEADETPVEQQDAPMYEDVPADAAPDRLVLTPALRVAGTTLDDPEIADASAPLDLGAVARQTWENDETEAEEEAATQDDDAPLMLFPQEDSARAEGEHPAMDAVDALVHDALETAEEVEGDYSDEGYWDDEPVEDSPADYDIEAQEFQREAEAEARYDADVAEQPSPDTEHDEPNALDDSTVHAEPEVPQEAEATEMPEEVMDNISILPLTAKIAALEAAVSGIKQEWEPDGTEEEDFTSSDTVAMAWKDDVDLDARGAPVVEDVETVEEIEDVAVEPEAAPEPTAFGAGTAGDDQLLDEEALRELVSEIVRAELQGALGERITRNVRKLVRREIHRALTAQELE